MPMVGLDWCWDCCPLATCGAGLLLKAELGLKFGFSSDIWELDSSSSSSSSEVSSWSSCLCCWGTWLNWIFVEIYWLCGSGTYFSGWWSLSLATSLYDSWSSTSYWVVSLAAFSWAAFIILAASSTRSSLSWSSSWESSQSKASLLSFGIGALF